MHVHQREVLFLFVKQRGSTGIQVFTHPSSCGSLRMGRHLVYTFSSEDYRNHALAYTPLDIDWTRKNSVNKMSHASLIM